MSSETSSEAISKMRRASKRGSATVEAALIFPVIILTVAAMISCSFELMERIDTAADTHLQETDSFMKNMLFTTEDILRGKWILT